MSESLELGAFNALPAAEASAWLEHLCSSPRWAAEVAAGRPYADRAAVLEASDAVFAGLGPADLDAALAGHPRIGATVSAQGHSADLSRAEQSSMGSADDQVKAALREGNIAYERRFDRVFLIRAAGRSPHEMLAELQRRLDNDDDTEIAEVREQLRQITRLRLQGAL
ncbi:2-oxo-4-hydroxy-4-carboxy-5-ureidoimidazoline decarboxylase [Branchiibius hedensis]|uniref:2-oxo-4-hydroxy-4-carboxy-5-ureidoimidazoline decarboxylase n=1 Tax=Branchiibius hedensis TaxID=672460 RepID=A0A2Y8ZUX1_9MICO|nr:2-oxo-4-hydroxy-4-carboxy-5-ureidoimidazoline decarboxylase [Branchiibius hedensis]PWJ27400.1 2-oxo-4-hydroxy-4-carboxy-5-ureidoimidazoline decarboxylase [Branchiibius hedensis]SSA36210.1 2-oxo-4-hydroxy-4-carboxy-5-ureidoimidazoline decarboxylase [Branchiibius hedensis]